MPFLKNFMRISIWWHYKAAALMAFIYAKAFINIASPLDLALPAIVFFVAVVGIASAGYFINDLADINEDRITGKENFPSRLTLSQNIYAGILLIVLTVVPWFYLETNATLIAFLILQFALYFLYSFKPFRLKNRHVWGILADALYGHVIPALVTLMVFSYYGQNLQMLTFNNLFIIILIIWQMCKGCRNILLHQIDDRKKDKHTGIRTFVVNFGGVFTLNLINRLILPLEIIVFSTLIYFASNTFSGIYWIFALFFIVTFLKFSLWKIFVLPPRQMRFKFLYFMNDFYENWLPLIMLGYLISYNQGFVFYLLVHLVLFPKTFVNITKDVVLITTRKKVLLGY